MKNLKQILALAFVLLTSINIDTKEVGIFKDKTALVHVLERCCSFASYTISVTDKDGKVSGYLL
tara:strand:+ start:1829 stop:2020 length:192 start_codon:yes stop_codon:yes gene_type:complete